MARKNPLENKANATIRYLRNADLLTHEHDLTVEIIKSLCSAWDEATTATQKASLSKELRYNLEMLPKPEATASDAAADFLAGLADDE